MCNQYKPKVKSLSFTKKYEREFQYLMKIKNASQYVCELIKKDLDKKENTKKIRRKFKLIDFQPYWVEIA